MITGYFFDPERSKRQIIKTAKLNVIAIGLYFLWHLVIAVFRNNLVSYFSSNFTLSNIIKFVIFNDSRIGSHLWYLNAILYVIVVVALLRKVTPHNWKNILYAITPILLAGDLIFGKYSIAFFGREFSYIIVRNWLFVGIPYFTLGMWIRENETTINEKMGKNGRLICCCGLLFFCITTIFERWILISNSLNATRDHYLSTTFLAISVFVFFLRFVDRNENWISKIGKLDTTWIYILHPLVITVMGAIMSRICVMQNLYEYSKAIIIFLATTMLIEVMLWVKVRLCTKFSGETYSSKKYKK